MKKILILLIALMILSPLLFGQEGVGRTSIERIYDSLALEEAAGLKQFGYELIGAGKPTTSILVDDGYILAPGDKLRVYLWGDSVDRGVVEPYHEVVVDFEGKIFLGPIGRITAHGLSIGEIERIISDRMMRTFSDIYTDVSAASIREFSIYISGFVQKPGSIEVNALWTVVDALGLAGGPAPEGTLRSIQLWRDGNVLTVDLYDLFLNGQRIRETVREGDVIYVPPVAKTAAAAGEVKRPGIYEMRPGETVEDLLTYAGGVQISSAALTSRLIKQNGTSVTVQGTSSDTQELSTSRLQDGDLLLVSPGNAFRSNMVRITGAVLYPGIYDLDGSRTLSALIERAGLRYDADKKFGTIFRENVDDADAGIVFSPEAIISGEAEDIPLRPNDVIQFYTAEPTYTREPIRVTGLVTDPGVVAYEQDMRLLDVLKHTDFTQDPRQLQIRIIRNEEVHAQIYLYDLLVRGNRTLNAAVAPGDMIAAVVNEESENLPGIQVLGQVGTPGVYSYTKGLHLSDVIEEAGGFTGDAYPQALYLIRESVKDEQLDQIRKTISVTRQELNTIEANIAADPKLSSDEKSLVNAQIAGQRALLERSAEDMGERLGRIALTIPGSLKKLRGSEDDVLVREGDYIYIPERSDYITVIGDVDSTVALPWSESKKVKDYLFDLGGLRPRDYNITILKHNGKVVKEDNLFYGWSTIEGQRLDPGDAVIAVRKIEIPVGTKILSTLTEVTETVFNIAYTLNTINSL